MTYQILVLYGLLFGVCDDSPLEESCLLLRPVLLDVAFPVLRLRTNLLVYLIGLQVRDNLESDNGHLVILLNHQRGGIFLAVLSMCPTSFAGALKMRHHRVIALDI